MCRVRAEILTVPSPPQGCPRYLHLLHLHLHQQQLPHLLRAQRRPHSFHPRLWMAWAEGPYSAPSRISKKELWGKPKPVIIVLLRLAKASCLHSEGKVLFFFFLSPPPPEVPSFWMNNCWASTATYDFADAHIRGFSREKHSLQVEWSQAGIAALRNILLLGYYRNLVHPLLVGSSISESIISTNWRKWTKKQKRWQYSVTEVNGLGVTIPPIPLDSS